MVKAIALAIAFAASFALMMFVILVAIHLAEAHVQVWTGLLIAFAGFVSFWRFLPETK